MLWRRSRVVLQHTGTIQGPSLAAKTIYPLGEAPEDGIDLALAVDLEEGLRARFCDSKMGL